VWERARERGRRGDILDEAGAAITSHVVEFIDESDAAVIARAADSIESFCSCPAMDASDRSRADRELGFA
jgi:hypothetical protein